jgi:hypothetical protein
MVVVEMNSAAQQLPTYSHLSIDEFAAFFKSHAAAPVFME